MDNQFFHENQKSNENDIDMKNDIFNYKGYFAENEINDEQEQKFFEFGAHFPYKILYKRLEVIAEERKQKQLMMEKKLSEKEKKEELIKKIQKLNVIIIMNHLILIIKIIDK